MFSRCGAFVLVQSLAIEWVRQKIHLGGVAKKEATSATTFDPDLTENRWCKSAEDKFGGYCRKNGFDSPGQCYAIHIPGTVAIQFRDGGCDFYRLVGDAPKDCPAGYHAGRGTTTTSYKTLATHYSTIFCKLVSSPDRVACENPNHPTLQSCTMSKQGDCTGQVRMGHDTRWTDWKSVAGAFTCSNQFFGHDPAYGQAKECICATRVACENQAIRPCLSATWRGRECAMVG